MMMKNILLLVLTIATMLSCESNEVKIEKIISEMEIPDNVKETLFRGYMMEYFTEWEDYHLKNKTIAGKFHEYFGDNDYRIIFHGDMNADDTIEYFAVKEYPEIVKGITKGMIIDDQLNVFMYIDLETGFYTNNFTYYDFSKIGLSQEDIMCIRLLWEEKDIHMPKNYIEKNITGLPNMIFNLHFQLIDKNKHMIIHYTNNMAKYFLGRGVSGIYFPQTKEFIFDISTIETKEDWYEKQKYYVDVYRENKEKGLTVEAVNFDPEEYLRTH